MVKKVVFCGLAAAVALYGAENKTKLDTTVITTTGFESPLRDEVKNVTIITADDISKMGYRSIREALEKAPGVTFVGEEIDMRGQGVSPKGDTKSRMATKILLDGIPVNVLDTAHVRTPSDMISIDDVEQIEIIPGGGSVLYGSGTRGGVINIITKQNPRKFYANVSSKIGSYKYRDLHFGIGGMANEKLYLKLSGKASKGNGYQEGDRLDNKYANGSFTFMISDAQRITLNSSYYADKSNLGSSLTKEQLDTNRRQGDTDRSYNKTIKFDVGLDYYLKASENFDLNIMPFFQHYKHQDKSFQDKKRGINLKGRYSYESGEFITGYEYLWNKGLRHSDFSMPAGPGKMRIIANTNATKQTHSVYALEKHNFTDKFSLNGGARYEWAKYNPDRMTSVGFTINKPGMPPVAQPPKVVSINSKKDINNYAFEIAPNFKYSDTGNVYVKFERGYISPSPTQLTDRIPVAGTKESRYELNNLQPETFQTYEVGMKDLIMGQYFSATLYLTDTKDEILVDTTGPHIPGQITWRYLNLSQTRRYGAEIYAEQFFVEDTLKLSQTFSYVKAKVTKGEYEGNKVAFVPESKFVFGVDYSPVKNLNFITDLKYLGKSYDLYENKMGGRTVVDFVTKYKFNNGVSVMAGIKNLFNKKYNDYEDIKSDLYYPAAERNYFIELKYAY